MLLLTLLIILLMLLLIFINAIIYAIIYICYHCDIIHSDPLSYHNVIIIRLLKYIQESTNHKDQISNGCLRYCHWSSTSNGLQLLHEVISIIYIFVTYIITVIKSYAIQIFAYEN